MHFEPGSKYIGKNYFDFSDAAAYYGTNGYCITWVQVSLYNQHFGASFPLFTDERQATS